MAAMEGNQFKGVATVELRQRSSKTKNLLSGALAEDFPPI